jgi:hypothetical protein
LGFTCVVLFCALACPERALAEPCFAADNDATYDQDGAINGIVTVTAASTSLVPPAETPYECGALSFVISAGAQLIFDGNAATGAAVRVEMADLIIESGGAISADERGCPSMYGGTFSSAGSAPNASNVCSTSEPGGGRQGNDFGGSGGGAHGGDGGLGQVGSGGVRYGSATAPGLFGAAGGTSGLSVVGPDASEGGGVVELSVDAFLHDGLISADGGDGGGAGGRSSGGGAGGSIKITATTIDGSTGTFSARGGNGGGTSGGGAGGRIAIEHGGGTFDFDNGDFDASGGSGQNAGAAGSVYVRNTVTDSVRVFSGFTFDDTALVASSWESDSSAFNQTCAPDLDGASTPSITAGSVTIGGNIDCAAPVASFTISQTDSAAALTLAEDAGISVNGSLLVEVAGNLAAGSGASLAATAQGAALELALQDGDDQNWDGITMEAGAEGRLRMDAAVALQLMGATQLFGNVSFPHLTGLSLDATSAIIADEKGCQGPDAGQGGVGAGPTCANVCTLGERGSGRAGNDFGGSGGGGHGGAGADGNVGAGGTIMGTAADPRLFGASSGGTGAGNAPAGAGGGLIEIVVDGVFANDGLISADGGDGGVANSSRVTGGGSGGAINIVAGEYACTTGGLFSANGGEGVAAAAGVLTGSGSGGGGRVMVDAAIDTCVAAPLSLLSAATVAPGGASDEPARTGAAGTVVVNDRSEICANPLASVVAARAGSRFDDRSAVVTASDALFILQAAVGSKCCTPCVCDSNGSGDVTASDALLALQRAVGVPVDLACAPCGG